MSAKGVSPTFRFSASQAKHVEKLQHEPEAIAAMVARSEACLKIPTGSIGGTAYDAPWWGTLLRNLLVFKFKSSARSRVRVDSK